MAWARRGFLIVVSLMAVLALAGRADAGKAKGGKADEIRELLDKATAAFALNHYAEAADSYEKAFALKPDAAVLYNAAQAHRLGGNKERALELYQSYLRMYGTEKRAEIEKHVENLKQAIEKDRAVATSPPTTPAPVGGTSAAAAPPPPKPEPPPPAPETTPAAPAETRVALAAPPDPPPPKVAEPAPVLVGQPVPPRDDDSILKKPWFWVVAGGAVVAAAAVAAIVLLKPDPIHPATTLDPVNGN